MTHRHYSLPLSLINLPLQILLNRRLPHCKIHLLDLLKNDSVSFTEFRQSSRTTNLSAEQYVLEHCVLDLILMGFYQFSNMAALIVKSCSPFPAVKLLEPQNCLHILNLCEVTLICTSTSVCTFGDKSSNVAITFKNCGIYHEAGTWRWRGHAHSASFSP